MADRGFHLRFALYALPQPQHLERVRGQVAQHRQHLGEQGHLEGDRRRRVFGDKGLDRLA